MRSPWQIILEDLWSRDKDKELWFEDKDKDEDMNL